MGTIEIIVGLIYLLAASCFIIGLKRLSSPKTARSGNIIGASGMLLAVIVTLLVTETVGIGGIIGGFVLGGTLGAIFARKVQMTAMPQMVAIFNGFGGAASVLVASAEYLRLSGGEPAFGTSLTIGISILIGSITFSGSMVAFGKLQEIINERAVVFKGQHAINALLLLGILAIGGYVVAVQPEPTVIALLAAIALVLGVLIVIPIGGADMPVVVALLNSYSGLAAASTGFVLQNNALIISGALVGASGLILTRIMCVAMNRSLANVLFGGFGSEVATITAGGDDGRVARDVNAEDAAIMLGYARSVVFVPGYGMAVSQAQHNVRELGELLEARGVDVRYAVHPVAGRMPGHMNVLLAEANVPYPQLFEMDDINPEFPRTDVAVVIGANDVVNPDARTETTSPIYGMPILDVDYSGHVIVLKRSLNVGFAGIDNPLFYNENTRMLFGDARKSLTSLAAAVKGL